MKDDLAEALLSAVMKWDFDILSKEITSIQRISEIKYNDYQRYTHGMRYVESLATWLNNFDMEDRDSIYNFIKDNLLYISYEQMIELINNSFDLKIKPMIIQETNRICNELEINEIDEKKKVFKYILRKCLFLGLSDGSHIDLFRRSNQSNLSHEQINLYYDFSLKKVNDLKRNLKNDIAEMDLNVRIQKKPNFQYIFLIDDFSASGISFIRKEKSDWDGKIKRFVDSLEKYDFDLGNLQLYIIIYVATPDALKHIEDTFNDFSKNKKVQISIRAFTIQNINKSKIDNQFITILEKYYNQYNMRNIVDGHYRKGIYDHPYLGFNECGLPLVIYHNTPNNALPIIWFDDGYKYRGLFPRSSRHKEVR